MIGERRRVTKPPIPEALQFTPETRFKDLVFVGCLGFGDNFYQRPVIRHLLQKYRTVYLRTALPEAYWDMPPNLRFINPGQMNLRTQQRQIAQYPSSFFSTPPPTALRIDWSCFPPFFNRDAQGRLYQWGVEYDLTNAEHIRQRARMTDYDFSFPLRPEWLTAAKELISTFTLRDRPLCIIRPPTVRREWCAPARNPKPEYFQLLLDHYRGKYFFVSIADLLKNEEWMSGELHGLQAQFHSGEIPLTTIFGMMKLADMTLCYPGFFMLVAIAVGAKCFTIFGGMQKPEVIFDPLMGLPSRNFSYIAPSPFCNCLVMGHNCNKELAPHKVINKFEALRTFQPLESLPLKTVTIACPPGLADLHWVMTKAEAFKAKNGIERLRVAIFEDSGHLNNGQFLEMLPFVNEVVRWPRPFHFNFAINGGEGRPMTKDQQGVDYMLEFNSHLESGKGLEEVLPEYETHWDYPIVIPPASRNFALDLRDNGAGGRLYLIYASSNHANAKWAGKDWLPQDWMTLVTAIHRQTGRRVVIIGAQWDRDYTNELMRLDKSRVLIDYIGKTNISQVLALLQQANLFVGYLSGLDVMAVHFGTPCAVFWPVKGISDKGLFSRGFLSSWVPPWTVSSSRYIPLIYGSAEARPEPVFERVKEFL